MTFLASIPLPMARIRTNPPLYEPTAASLALKMRRIELGKSQADVAFDSDILTQTTVSELERGKYGPQDLTAARLAALAKGLNWTVAELERSLDLNLGLGGLVDVRPLPQDGAVQLIEPSADGLVEVPVYGIAVANPDGNMEYVRPIGVARIPSKYNTEHSYTYMVLGDSMDDGTRDGIRDGDKVVCNHADTDLVEGDLYIVKVPGNGILLKRVRSYADGEIYLASDNPKYRNLSPEDAQIIGRVTWVDPAGYAP